MRLTSLSSLSVPLFALALLPLIAQACAASQVEGSTSTGGGDGGASSASTSAATGGAASASSSSTGGGPCQSAADCAGSADACNTGACINGVCGKLPANELGACDDGINCTENDTCQNGVCTGGTTKFCPATDTCSVGSCDTMTDTCVQVAGNDGAPCNDNDACTLPGSCLAGVCNPGGMVDCSFLDGTCSIGFCDPQIGCKVMPQADGSPCDDNLYCTINDVCTNGQCAGSPNTCAAPGDVCKIGMCNEAAKSCVAVNGPNGIACNDNNLCTSGETCLNGICQGGVAANNGMACNDNNGCTNGTSCQNGVCGAPTSMVMQCINGDDCCPAGCVAAADDDCVNLTGVFAQYASEGRNVYIWKTPVQCAPLAQYTTFCQDHGLAWWSPKSQADAQQLITFAYNLDQTHTWIQVYQSTTTDVNGKVGPYNVVVDSPGCVEGSISGWTAFRKWGCSFCDPESNAQQQDDNQSCCWDKGHPYDWFVCEG